MPTCQAIVRSTGQPCQCRAKRGFDTCLRHRPRQPPADATVCNHPKTNGSLCTRVCVSGDTLCSLHRKVVDRHERERVCQLLLANAIEMLWGLEQPRDFNHLSHTIEDAFQNGVIVQEEYDILIFELHEEWMWYRRERIVTTSQAKTELERLAMDRQNVHTKEVNQQTADVSAYILTPDVPEDRTTLLEIERAWADKNKAHRNRVLKDMKHWYRVSECVTPEDWLYARMLDGVWTRIHENPDLIQRLWEESLDSVGTCCQGHISRLANVFVGFSQDVVVERPVGDVIQERISDIARKDMSIPNKVYEVWRVCEDLHVPMDERNAWIEAL